MSMKTNTYLRKKQIPHRKKDYNTKYKTNFYNTKLKAFPATHNRLFTLNVNVIL